MQKKACYSQNWFFIFHFNIEKRPFGYMEFVFHFSFLNRKTNDCLGTWNSFFISRFLNWKTNGRLGTRIVVYFSCLAKRHGFQGLNLKRQINICFLFFVLKLKNEWPLSYIFVFLRTIVPSWFWFYIFSFVSLNRTTFLRFKVLLFELASIWKNKK